jgi:hypothetical protein
MTLTNEESGLVFDCFFRCAEQEHVDRGTALIASNPKAAEIYSCIKRALAQLEHMKDDCCPDELVNLTMARLKLATAMKSLPHKNSL